jgi:hypothetical protein
MAHWAGFKLFFKIGHSDVNWLSELLMSLFPEGEEA